MRYYKLMYDYANSNKSTFININETELTFQRYDVNNGISLNVDSIFCSYSKDGIDCIYTDYVANNLAWMVVSKKIKNILETFCIGETQFIPMIEKSTAICIGYLVNVINTVDALDLDKSLIKEMTYHKDGKEELNKSIIKYAVREDKVGESDLFKLKDCLVPCFISERLMKRLEKEQVTGFDFLGTGK